MRRRIYLGLVGLFVVVVIVRMLSPRETPRYHLAAIRNSDYVSLTSWRNYLRSRTWVWLARGAPNREHHEKALLEMGFFQLKTFTFINRTDWDSEQVALNALLSKETFPDGCWTQAHGPEPNVLRITASTNDMVIWERVIREWDRPHTK
jgi:hypothetical protein